MKIAICDDEILYGRHLEALINQYAYEQEVAVETFVFSNPNHFLSSDITAYDIVFLDVLIGNVNGMDVALNFREKNKKAVLNFISAFVEYAPKGYEVDAFRYLLKSDLVHTLNSCLYDSINKCIQRLQTLQIRTTDGCTKIVQLSDVMYFESFSHNVKICFKDKRLGDFKTYDTLSKFEEKLPSTFMRIQRSYIVNLMFVCYIKGVCLTLADGETISCRRQMRDDVLRRFIELQGE